MKPVTEKDLRRAGSAAAKASRRQRQAMLDRLRGRCHTMTVEQAMELTGRSRQAVNSYARELGEQFKASGKSRESVRVRHRRMESECLRLAQMWR